MSINFEWTHEDIMVLLRILEPTTPKSYFNFWSPKNHPDVLVWSCPNVSYIEIKKLYDVGVTTNIFADNDKLVIHLIKFNEKIKTNCYATNEKKQ